MVELKAVKKCFLEVFEQPILDSRSGIENMPNKKVLKGMNFWEETISFISALRFTRPSSFRRRMSLRKKRHF